MSALARLRQGLRALSTWTRPVEDDRARTWLTPALFDLYRQMRRSERQHSLRVLADLEAAGHAEPDLLVAALLHDVGKIQTAFFLPEKVLVVLVKAFIPAAYWRWGSGSTRGWRRPFAVSVQHPAWGAAMVQTAGAPPCAVELVARHQEVLPGSPRTETERLLLALQTADNRN